MAAKRRGNMAPYVALLIAVVIFVPPVRQAVITGITPLLDVLEDLNPFRS